MVLSGVRKNKARKEGDGRCWNCGGAGISSNRLIGEDLPEKGTFAQFPEEGEGGSFVDVWGRAFRAAVTASAKALGQA